MEKVPQTVLGANTEQTETLPTLAKVKSTIYVNGMEVAENDATEAINVAIKGVIMRAQGSSASFVEGMGWVKHPSKAVIGMKGELVSVRVPEWNPVVQDHDTWKAEAKQKVAKSLQQLDFIVKHLDVARATPDEILAGGRAVTPKVKEVVE